MKKINKKGFTIVELVIVIAVIAILAAVLIPTFSSLVKTAQTSSDVNLVKNLNTSLTTSEILDGKNETITDALNDVKEDGFDVTKLTPTNSDNEILWDEESNRFVLYVDEEYESCGSDVEVDESKLYKLWKIYNEVEELESNPVYSIYWNVDADLPEGTKLSVGFDAGTTKNVSEVIYENTSNEAKEVIIRTNTVNTTLRVDALTDTINHYGNVGKVDVVKVDMNCYNEYGNAAYVKVTEGKVVAKDGGKINVLFANNANSSNVVAVTDGGLIEQGYTLADDAGASNIELTTSTTEEVEKIAQEAINTAIENTVFAGVAITKAGEATQLMTIEAFRDTVNAGNTYAGYTVKLLDDINLDNADWTPIGNSANAFSGVFDGQGYTISNLKVNSTSGYAGLFGNVTGTAADAPHTSNGVWDSTSNTVILNSYSEDKYTAVVKNLVIDGFEVTNTSGDYVGAAVAYGKDAYFANLTVKNGNVNGNGKTGGVIGATGENVVLDYLSTESSVTVSSTGHSVGGIIGGVNRGGKTEHLAVIANCTNRANVYGADTSNGIAAGILGHGGSTSGLNVAIINCANYGEIKCQTRTAGIVAQAQKVKLILNCVNYGKVWNEAESGNNILGGIAGQCDTNGLQIVACMNNGQVTGFAGNGKIAGIIGSASSTTIEGCVNRGVITNTKTNGTYADITAGATNVLVADNATYTVDRSVTFTSVTITGEAATCTSIVIDNDEIKKVFVAIDNFNGTITGLAGKTLYISGANSTVTIPQDTAIEKVIVNGTNCTIINNGTIGTIRFEVAGNNSIENNGTIANTTDIAFTISSTVNGANVAIINNGIIAASESEGAYALYFGSGAACTVNNQGTITGNNFGKVTVSE